MLSLKSGGISFGYTDLSIGHKVIRTMLISQIAYGIAVWFAGQDMIGSTDPLTNVIVRAYAAIFGLSCQSHVLPGIPPSDHP